MRLFIFGYGFSARAIAAELAPDCEWVAGTSRDSGKLAAMQADGVRGYQFDGYHANNDISAALAEATHVIISAGPDGEGDPVLRCHRRDIANAPNLKWIGYLSTIGVYGDYQGAWVDEKCECRPVSKRSKDRVAVEGAWQSFAAEIGVKLGIFRLAGIYGPGRSVMTKLRDGKARRINKKDQVFNRIHIEDIALAVGIAAKSKQGGIYNVCDNEPAPPQDVIAYCAELMGKEVPELLDFETAKMTPMARTFYGENKRCSNKKLLKLIGGKMRYPTYREAFTHMWQSDNWQ